MSSEKSIASLQRRVKDQEKLIDALFKLVDEAAFPLGVGEKHHDRLASG